MKKGTGISWATVYLWDGTRLPGETWNGLGGCRRVSRECSNCYAIVVEHNRLSGPGQRYAGLTRMVKGKPDWTGHVALFPDKLDLPLRWTTPRGIFVNSMSDVFHIEVPVRYIQAIFEVLANSPHVGQILTKRPERMAALMPELWRARDLALPGVLADAGIESPAVTRALAQGRLRPLGDFDGPPPNIWLGTSIGENAAAYRADYLAATPAAVRFISAEPLIGPVDRVNLAGIHQVITGGESGEGHRPFDPAWAEEMRALCARTGVAFYHKQGGGRTARASGDLLNGVRYRQYPAVFPDGHVGVYDASHIDPHADEDDIPRIQAV